MNNQQIFEKNYSVALINKLNQIGEAKTCFLGMGNHLNKETDVVCQQNGVEIGIEVLSNPWMAYRNGKFYRVDIMNSGVEYTKQTDLICFLTTKVSEKINKNYKQTKRWLLIPNLFHACNAKDIQTIFLDDWNLGWGKFERVFWVFGQPPELSFYELDKPNERLLLLE